MEVENAEVDFFLTLNDLCHPLQVEPWLPAGSPHCATHNQTRFFASNCALIPTKDENLDRMSVALVAKDNLSKHWSLNGCEICN